MNYPFVQSIHDVYHLVVVVVVSLKKQRIYRIQYYLKFQASSGGSWKASPADKRGLLCMQLCILSSFFCLKEYQRNSLMLTLFPPFSNLSMSLNEVIKLLQAGR